MTRQERAKQFMPFDAMKGLQEALRDREERHSRVERRGISDEQMAKNSRLIEQLCKGNRVAMECYRAFHDVRMEGCITEINIALKYLMLEEEKIYFEDIYSIELLDLGRR